MINHVAIVKNLILLLFCSYLLSSKNISNEQILNHLKEEKNWILIEQRKDKINVFEMDIPQMNLNALKVEKIVEIDPYKAIDIVMNIGNYPEVMENNTMTSFIIGEKKIKMYVHLGPSYWVF